MTPRPPLGTGQVSGPGLSLCQDQRQFDFDASVEDPFYGEDSAVWTPEGPATLTGSVSDVLACLVAFQLIDAVVSSDVPAVWDGYWYEPGS